MRLIKILTATALVLALTACGGSTLSVGPNEHPRLDQPDSANTQVCKGPVPLPAGTMTQRQIEDLWGTDRFNLVDCGKRQSGFVDYIKERDSALRQNGI